MSNYRAVCPAASIKGKSNWGYHYLGSSRFFIMAGDAFAKRLVELMKGK